jgi:hypothetical protein
VKFHLLLPLLLASLGFIFPGRAQQHEAAGESPAGEPDAPPAIRQTGDGIFQIGKIRLDKNTKTASFPASVNMDQGIAEYLLVRTGGKTHESLFVTEIAPYDLHVAMLLLGVKDRSKDKQDAAAPPQTLNGAYLKTAPDLLGDNVLISVVWTEGDITKRASAEDFLLNKKENVTMSRGPWLYTGSEIVNGKLLAQEERSIAALVLDPAALINNPRAGNRDDAIWAIDLKKTPPAGTAVELAIKLEPSAKPEHKKQ